MGAGGVKSSAGKGQRGKVAVLCGLAMILVAVCVRLVRSSPDAGLAAAPPAAVPVATPGATSVAAAPARPVAANVIAWPKAAARDPFRSTKVYPPPVVKVDVPATAPVAVKPAPPPVNFAALAREKISLKGTVQGERSLAMVNGRLCRVGQTVEGFRIVEIGKRTITVEKGGVRVVVEPD
jgi:hypothetical protein